MTKSWTVRRSRLLAAALALALSAPALAGEVHTGGLSDSGQFDRFIIRFAKGTPEAKDVAARQNALDGAGRAEGVGVAHQLRLAVGADVIRSSRKLDRARAESLMRRLANNPDVEYVEVDKLNHFFATPNDTSYPQQWQYFNATGGIRADQAWNLSTGAGVVVAVLDTGITNHSELNANVLPGYDFIKDIAEANDGNGRDGDAHDPGDWEPAGACEAGSAATNSSWHGTHVAGSIAAVTNNAKGVAGTAYNARILPVRVLGRCGGYDSDIADAMVWASGGAVSGVPANPYPAEVISLSLGGSGACGSTTQAAINSAVSRGTTLVIAAGNAGSNVSNSSPANCGNVIAVGATTSTGAKASYSNYGAGVDIAAPGSSILSTLNAGSTTPGAEAYATYSGTSMATPHVSGVVALMQAYASTPKTPAQIESILKSTARPFPVAPSQPIGAGIVDAYAAVQAVNGAVSPPPSGNVAPVAKFSVATSGLTANFTDTSTDSDGSIVANSWTFGDGFSSSIANPSHTYAAAGAYTVTEWVRDNAGVIVSTSKSVTVGSVGNVAPVAKFSVATSGLTANFSDTSTDSDGSIVANSWTFGDGFSSSIANPSHTYAAAGTYTVTEWVRDNAGVIVSTSKSVTVGSGVLSNGVAVLVPATGSGNWSPTYTMVVPAGRTTLTFSMTGGSGDADLYVRRSSAPTLSAYDCRPYKTGNTETCTFNAPAAGTYYVAIRAYASFSNLSLWGVY